MISDGLPRSYFYGRLALAMREVSTKNHVLEFPVYVTLKEMLGMEDVVHTNREPGMVMKVNVQEALAQLVRCPVCSSSLETYRDYPSERACPNGCGDFSITEVWLNGDVTFAYKMQAYIEAEPTIVPKPPDEGS